MGQVFLMCPKHKLTDETDNDAYRNNAQCFRSEGYKYRKHKTNYGQDHCDNEEHFEWMLRDAPLY
jgi:hypothetical protein